MTSPTDTPPRAPAHRSPSTLRILAPLLSLLVFPGLGHAVAGYPWRALAWLGAIFATLVLGVAAGAVDLRLLWALPFAATMLAIIVAIDAAGVGKSPKPSSAPGWIAFAAGGLFLLVFSILGVPISIRVFLVESFKVPQLGMCPTFGAGDTLFVDKRIYYWKAPALGDIVVFSPPSQPRYDFIYRVAGVPGDSLEINEAGLLVRNGAPVPVEPRGATGCDGAELYEEELGGRHTIGVTAHTAVPGRYEVLPGELFVLGDNRQNAVDSRQLGPVPVAAVHGKATVRWQRSGSLVWETVR